MSNPFVVSQEQMHHPAVSSAGEKQMMSATTFKDFLLKNGILTTAAAMTIGFSTGVFIRGAVADLVMPTLYTLFIAIASRVNKKVGKVVDNVFRNHQINFINFIQELIAYALVIATAFIVIEQVNRYMGSNAYGKPAKMSSSAVAVAAD